MFNKVILNPCEAASLSWQLNHKRNIGCKIVLAISSAISAFFRKYKITVVYVSHLLQGRDGYNDSYFVKSLKNRGIKIPTPSPNLLIVPEKFKSHYKILIDGGLAKGKSTFINALMNKHNDTYGIRKNKIETEFHELNKSILLCELPNTEHFMNDSRYRNFDAVVLIQEGSLQENDGELMKIIQGSKKPYLFVKTNMCREIKTGIQQSGLDENEVIALKKKKILDELATYNFSPSNGMPFLIDSEHPEEFNFQEVKEAIINKEFYKTNEE